MLPVLFLGNPFGDLVKEKITLVPILYLAVSTVIYPTLELGANKQRSTLETQSE